MNKMVTQVQFRRGTTAQHASFTGANGEITIDTDKETAVVHDGTTAGGFPLQTTTGLSANVAAYLPNYAGVVNGSSHTVGTSFTANSTVVNAVSYIIGSSLVSNTVGIYHTGTVNAASYTVGVSTIANSTGVYTGVVNGSSITVGSSLIGNSSGVYHTGTVNAASHTVGVSTIANSTGVYTGVVNATTISTGSVNVVNASGLTTTANVNIGAAGELIVAAGAGIYANGGLGTSGDVLHSNGSSIYWATDDQGVTSVATGNGLTGGTITTTGTLSVLANTGLVANATGLHVNSSVMLTSGNQTLSGGFSVTSYNLGTGSGTVTPSPVNGNYQYMTNNGAFTLAAPASDCAIDILVTNGASAGSITFSGFTVPTGGGGDTYATTNANRFLLMIRRINSISTYVWKALQ
jgi:hypothetical protein